MTGNIGIVPETSNDGAKHSDPIQQLISYTAILRSVFLFRVEHELRILL